jgi:AcrR family transcriptional regulator
MEAATRPRSTRDRPAKAPLSEDAIVAAALRIARDEGFDSVTMRRVATELDTGAASLYVYVANRKDLLLAMLDRALGTVQLIEPEPTRWRAQVHDLLDGWRQSLEAYPGLAAAHPVEPLTSTNVLRGLENLLGLLLAGGITPQDAAWACDILSLMVTATAAEADARRAAGQMAGAELDDVVAELRTTFAGLPADRFPHIVAHASELVSGEAISRFRFGIDTFLDGLLARSGRA